jgi:uncharacterized protein (DUF305 family)
MLAIASLALAAPAVAEDTSMEGHGQHDTSEQGASPSTAAFMAANDVMHRDMAIDYTGDADIDFARAMIAHHQGAIDMAKVELEHGDDPAMRKLAEDVIAAQEKEIVFMQAWLAEHAGK